MVSIGDEKGLNINTKLLNTEKSCVLFQQTLRNGEKKEMEGNFEKRGKSGNWRKLWETAKARKWMVTLRKGGRQEIEGNFEKRRKPGNGRKLWETAKGRKWKEIWRNGERKIMEGNFKKRRKKGNGRKLWCWNVHLWNWIDVSRVFILQIDKSSYIYIYIYIYKYIYICIYLDNRCKYKIDIEYLFWFNHQSRNFTKCDWHDFDFLKIGWIQARWLKKLLRTPCAHVRIT